MGWNCVLRVLQLEKSVCSYRARLVLYALACHAPDETLKCFPSIAALEEETALSRSGVFRALAELEEAGLVVRKSGRNLCGVNEYRLTVHKSDEECQVETLKSVRLRHVECQIETRKRKEKHNLLVSKLVSMPGKSVRLKHYVHNSAEEGANLPPSAGNYGACQDEGAAGEVANQPDYN